MGASPTHPDRIKRPWAVRSCPPEFARTYIEGGWFAVELEFGLKGGTGSKIILRWISESGGETLIRTRRAHMRNNRVKASVAVPQAAE